MERSKIIAIITGAISLILALGYLLLVQLLDFRGPMQPAPQSQVPQAVRFISFPPPVAGGLRGVKIPLTS
ncbi:hypothetical protein [Argonema galeatum]|uniref:hypothetical protein n=1 Tax=Argonema galeatum TaxID=2942762 RepID=UPI0020114A09|nr:hypothetical protein [Argonema galeatum]MCL1464718.1 glucose-inhibited division protein A [Argonema galeatum A003/A1]